MGIVRRSAMAHVTAIAVALASRIASAQGSARVPDAAAVQAEVAIRGMLSERENLVSGVFRFKGTKLARSAGKPDIETTTHGLCAFDHSTGQFRYDDNEPTYVGGIDSRKLRDVHSQRELQELIESTPRTLFETKLRYIRNRECIFSWKMGESHVRNNICIKPVEGRYSLMGAAAESHHIYDVRACGVMDYREFEGKFDQGMGVAEFCTRLLSIPARSVNNTPNGTEFLLEDPNWKHELTIDIDHGFTAVKHVVTSSDEPPFVMTSTVQWAQRSRVWIPVAFETQLHFNDGTELARCSLTHEWECINESVNPRYFDYKTFEDIPTDHTAIVDYRGKAPIRLGWWKGNGIVEPLEPERDADPFPKRFEQQGRFSWIVAGNIVFAAVLIAWALWRRRGSRTLS
jgi:hypothetical protein